MICWRIGEKEILKDEKDYKYDKGLLILLYLLVCESF
jgi:hypothetical protein